MFHRTDCCSRSVQTLFIRAICHFACNIVENIISFNRTRHKKWKKYKNISKHNINSKLLIFGGENGKYKSVLGKMYIFLSTGCHMQLWPDIWPLREKYHEYDFHTIIKDSHAWCRKPHSLEDDLTKKEENAVFIRIKARYY